MIFYSSQKLSTSILKLQFGFRCIMEKFKKWLKNSFAYCRFFQRKYYWKYYHYESVWISNWSIFLHKHTAQRCFLSYFCQILGNYLQSHLHIAVIYEEKREWWWRNNYLLIPFILLSCEAFATKRYNFKSILSQISGFLKNDQNLICILSLFAGKISTKCAL